MSEQLHRNSDLLELGIDEFAYKAELKKPAKKKKEEESE